MFNVSKNKYFVFFSSMFQDFSFIIHTYSLHFNLPFSTHSFSCHPMSNIYKPKNDVIYLWCSDDTYLVLTLLFHLILTYMSWLQPIKGGLHFILSDNGNYDFDIKVRRYGFVGFVNDEIDCGCLRCVFCFKTKEKEKDTLLMDMCKIYNYCLLWWTHY